MIANGQTNKGIAPQASLYASAMGTHQTLPGSYAQALETIQYVATRNNGDVRATNLSFNYPLVQNTQLDESSLLTLGMDWSARKHDVLYVVAGQYVNDAKPVPTDEYNGVTVGYTIDDGTGTIRRLFRDIQHQPQATEGRFVTDIVAPSNVLVPELGGGAYK